MAFDRTRTADHGSVALHLSSLYCYSPGLFFFFCYLWKERRGYISWHVHCLFAINLPYTYPDKVKGINNLNDWPRRWWKRQYILFRVTRSTSNRHIKLCNFRCCEVLQSRPDYPRMTIQTSSNNKSLNKNNETTLFLKLKIPLITFFFFLLQIK